MEGLDTHTHTQTHVPLCLCTLGRAGRTHPLCSHPLPLPTGTVAPIGSGTRMGWLGPGFLLEVPAGMDKDTAPGKRGVYWAGPSLPPSMVPVPWGGDELRGRAECGLWSRAAEGQPAPQPPTQAVLDPALLPLFHSRGLVGGPEHGDTAAPTGRGGSAAGGPGRGPSTAPHCPPEASLWRHRAGQVCPAPGPGCRNGWLSLPLPRRPRCGNPGLAEPPLSHTPEAHLVHALHSSVG